MIYISDDPILVMKKISECRLPAIFEDARNVRIENVRTLTQETKLQEYDQIILTIGSERVLITIVPYYP